MSQSAKRRARRDKLMQGRMSEAARVQAVAAPQKPPVGGQGGEATCLSPTQENIIVSQLAKHGWPITPKHRLAAVGVVARNLAHPDGRVSNGAARILGTYNEQNFRFDQADAGGDIDDQIEHQPQEIQASNEDRLQSLLAKLRIRLAERAKPLDVIDHEAPTSPIGDIAPTTNGHSNGEEP